MPKHALNGAKLACIVFWLPCVVKAALLLWVTFGPLPHLDGDKLS